MRKGGLLMPEGLLWFRAMLNIHLDACGFALLLICPLNRVSRYHSSSR
jgi:hypothetical protein